MRFKSIFLLYTIIYIVLTVFSYGFVDPNFPHKPPLFLHRLVFYQRPLATVIYAVIVLSLFILYGWILRAAKKKKINSRQVWRLVFLSVFLLFFSFPAFSHDIFNYMATAKVTFFYQENPYLIMPIEFVDEPMLHFMHAANKTALYGPFWILLTVLPHSLSGGNILGGVFSFKAFVILFYLGLAWLIWRLSRKNTSSLAFFALNPLVLIETLVSAHNDVVMMFFALLSFYFLFQKRRVGAFFSLLVSTGIKFATVVLWLPFFSSRWLKKELLFTFSFWLLFFIFLLSPLREEIYSWYVIWLLSFAALSLKNRFTLWLTLALSVGTLGRYLPFLYTRSWEGVTPMIKVWVTIIPPALVFLFFFLKSRLLKGVFR